MATVLAGTSVYFGDIHGARLSHLEDALRDLGIRPHALLCTMDLDQVLSMQDLLELEQRWCDQGRLAVLVPGNHEAALIYRIGIDSSTYGNRQQDTTILALTEAIDLPQFRKLREFVRAKLATEGGVRLRFGESEAFPALLIHGALAGKEEKYLHEFPAEIQEHVRRRTDLWLRLESGTHLRANFAAMREASLRLMIRGHDHYVGLRSLSSEHSLCSHQLVVNVVAGESVTHRTEKPRSGDQGDDLALVDSARLRATREASELYWHELDPQRRYVVNFGPYYRGMFGLVRAATGSSAPAIAFCQTGVSFYTAADREKRLKPFSLAEQAQAGKSFYELFPGKPTRR